MIKSFMYQLKYSSRFKKSYKRIAGNIRFKKVVYIEIVECLLNKEVLGQKYKNHKLKGDLEGVWKCHLAPDILLTYTYFENELVLLLVNIGTHSDLF